MIFRYLCFLLYKLYAGRNLFAQESVLNNKTLGHEKPASTGDAAHWQQHLPCCKKELTYQLSLMEPILLPLKLYAAKFMKYPIYKYPFYKYLFYIKIIA